MHILGVGWGSNGRTVSTSQFAGKQDLPENVVDLCILREKAKPMVDTIIYTEFFGMEEVQNT